MKMYHRNGHAWREHHGFRHLPRMRADCWERYKKLDPDTRRKVKGIVKGRIRGDHFETIGEAVGLNTYYVAHFTGILGIPSTAEFRMRRVAKLYFQGLSAPEVASRMGLTVRAVNNLRTRLHLPPFPREKRPPKHRTSFKLAVAGLDGWAADGLTARQIAEKMGVSRQTVYNWIKAARAA
jgi:transposase